MIRGLRVLAILSLGLMAGPAHAKLFDFKSAKVAAYVAGSFGWTIENTLNSKSNSTGAVPVTVNSEHPYNFSGEFGFIFGSDRVHIGFGGEVLHPKDIIDEKGKSSTNAELYSLTSEVSVIIPKGRIEVTVKRWSGSRLYIGAEAGWGYLIARNSYTFTAAGTTAYGGLADFYEDLRGNAPMYGGSVGFETVLTDTTALALSAGYRGLYFSEVNHNRDTTTFQGTVSKGDLARNANGTTRSMDLSGAMGSVMLRFWFR